MNCSRCGTLLIAARVSGKTFNVCPVCNTVHRVHDGRREVVTLQALIDQLEQLVPSEYKALIKGWSGQGRALRRFSVQGKRVRILFTMEKPPEGVDPALN